MPKQRKTEELTQSLNCLELSKSEIDTIKKFYSILETMGHFSECIT